jgi:hypothetical protein
MLAKNTRALVATVAVALITGIMMALWVALMPAPAQAQSGDVLRLLSIEVVNHTDDEDFGPFGDRADEPYIEVNGVNVWDAGNTNDHLSDGTTRTIDVSVPISGDNVSVQVWEADGGRQSVTNPDDLIGEFSARYTDGTEQTQTLSYKNGEAVYEIKYVVDRPIPGTNTPPEIVDVSPALGSKIKSRTPLISATVRDAQTDLDATAIRLFVDGSARTASYDKASDRLTYQSTKLARRQHTVRIEATDEKGLQTFNDWNFKIVRKK